MAVANHQAVLQPLVFLSNWWFELFPFMQPDYPTVMNPPHTLSHTCLCRICSVSGRNKIVALSPPAKVVLRTVSRHPSGRKNVCVWREDRV